MGTQLDLNLHPCSAGCQSEGILMHFPALGPSPQRKAQCVHRTETPLLREAEVWGGSCVEAKRRGSQEQSCVPRVCSHCLERGKGCLSVWAWLPW